MEYYGAIGKVVELKNEAQNGSKSFLSKKGHPPGESAHSKIGRALTSSPELVFGLIAATTKALRKLFRVKNLSNA